MAITSSVLPHEDYVFEPEKYMKQVVLDTHYYPEDWKDKAHTEQVEFFSSRFIAHFRFSSPTNTSLFCRS